MTVNINKTEINLIWLRDNCRCNKCYNWETNQRNNGDINLNNIQIEHWIQEGNHISVTWVDGHTSKYNINWIETQNRPETRIERILWSGNEIQNRIPTVSNTDEQMAKTLTTSLLKFGVGLVTDVPSTMEGTEQMVNKIGPIMHTIYGGMWRLCNTSGYEQYQDTAYTTQELSLHTDNTYFIEPAGLQIFHCIRPAEKGGETILLDGFKAAMILKKENPKYYEYLKSTPIEWQYISDQHHYTSVSPVIKTFLNSSEIEQIRYNIHDRSPRIYHTELYDQNIVYSALKLFRDIVNDRNMEWKLPLTPGTAIFINNWRVFHGRKAFSGTRVIVGCYMAMNALLSKARKLKVLS